MLVVTYIAPEDMFRLEQLMVRDGFIPGRRIGRIASIYITELLSSPLHITAPLQQCNARKASPNRLQLQIPSALTTLPSVYNLNDWSSLLTNIARGNLRPEEYPKCLIPHTDAAVQNYRYRSLVQVYESQSAVSQAILDTMLMPIQPPNFYTDMRPELSTLNTTSFTSAVRSSWYVQDLPRKRERISVSPSTREAILNLSEHYYIVHPTKQSEVSRIIAVLEALYCRLLVPINQS